MEIKVRSIIDSTMQPSLFYKAKGAHRPLLVGLHTWSFDRFNQVENMLPYAEKYDFNLLLPEFRGPNLQSIELYARIFEKYPNSRVFLDIFDGGHEIDMTAAMYWIISQYAGIEKSEITR